jgi:hypothetical protein
MKKYIILVLAVGNSVAFGQSKTIQKCTIDDGNALSIHVSGNVDGEDFGFDHTFDLSSLDKIARLVFKDKILDSIDLPVLEMPEQPTIPKAPRAPKAARAVGAPNTAAVPEAEVSSNDSDAETSADLYKNRRSAEKKSFSKEIKYNSECGELFMRYKYEKDGEEYEYERTVNAKNKTESERMHIIEETEKELGLTTIQ